jgi:hypothetical protein
MTARLSVLARPGTELLSRALVASLPLSFSIAGDARPADVIVLAGGRGWATEARRELDSEAQRVVVVSPGLDDADAIRALADSADSGGASVVLSETYAGNPGLAGAASRFEGAMLVAITGLTEVDLGEGLLVHLRMARALGLTEVRLDDAVSTASAHLASGSAQLGGRVLFRSLVTHSAAAPAQHTARGYAGAGLVVATVFDSDTARPASVTAVTGEGATELPTIYEHAHRSAFRALASGPSDSARLREFVADVETATAAYGGAER